MELLLYGGTGQAKVVRPIVERDGHRVAFVFDRDRSISPPFPCEMHHDEAALDGLAARCQGFVVCIGGIRGVARVALSQRLAAGGLIPVSAVHHTAYVADTATYGPGAQIMMRAVLGEMVRVADYTLVNTAATIDHECIIGTGVHVMPGATLAGLVIVEDHASVGSNATILPRVRVGRGAVIGAGAVVVRDVEPFTVVAGNPARLLKRLEVEAK